MKTSNLNALAPLVSGLLWLVACIDVGHEAATGCLAEMTQPGCTANGGASGASGSGGRGGSGGAQAGSGGAPTAGAAGQPAAGDGGAAGDAGQ